jgi:hypothetical protein
MAVSRPRRGRNHGRPATRASLESNLPSIDPSLPSTGKNLPSTDISLQSIGLGLPSIHSSRASTSIGRQKLEGTSGC